jgi:hypothetical protein
MESWRKVGSWLEPASLMVLALGPLVLGLAWGAYLDDRAYTTFHWARYLVSGHGLADFTAAGMRAVLQSPLYALTLALLARLGLPLPEAAWILSLLGWGAAAIAIYATGPAMRQPIAAMVSATLVVVSPIVVSTLGTGVPWAVALAGFAVAASVKRRWTAQACALVLLLCVRFDLSALVLAATLLILQWIERRRFPAWPSTVVAVAAVGWGLLALRHVVPAHQLLAPNVAEWGHAIQRLLGESEFYWLFLPFIGAGLLTVPRRALWLGLVWGAVAVWSGGIAASAMVAVLGLLLAGLGVEWIVRWVETHDLVRLDGVALAVSLMLVAGLPLGVAQVSSLVQRYQSRPVVREALERRAADWLRAYSEREATVLGSERVGYLADRTTIAWDGSERGPGELANLIEPLTEDPPAYCISFRSIAWHSLMQTVWFKDGYEPLQQFESPYDATSPFTIWGYRLRAFEPGDYQTLHVRLPGGVDWVAYKYGSERIQPGDAVHVTLFLQTREPVTESFQTVVGVVSPQDGVAWAQRNMITPRDVPVDWWQTGQVVAEQFVLTTTADIPIGAYELNASVASPDSKNLLPMYRRDDIAPLDRITLGYVVVPWQGSLDAAKRVGARLGEHVALAGYEAPGSVSPGTELDVTLYWEPLQPPGDDYVVFVHLLGAGGQLVASHDGPPMEGRYPTQAWLPGDIVPDVHHIALDPNIPAGTYHLQVGMYRWPSMERLPVRDEDGVEHPDRVVVLQPVEVR